MASETGSAWLAFTGRVPKNHHADRASKSRRAARALLMGAGGLATGLALSLSGIQGAGAGLTAAGAVMMLWGLHRYGRLGADPANGSANEPRDPE